MILELIQSSPNAINSIYIFRNFLDDKNYLNFLSDKIMNYTSTDEMNKSTNVKASMTTYGKLVEDPDFKFIHQKIIETLSNTYRMRSPTWRQTNIVELIDSWGMAHQKGDYTIEHVHGNTSFSGAFYFKVPSPTTMYFADYQEALKLEDNMLLLFPSLCKHSVGKHTGEEKRISMAFNINISCRYIEDKQ